MIQNVSGFGNFSFFGFQIQLRFLQVNLGGLNLDGILQFVRSTYPVAVSFHFGDLSLKIFNGGDQLLLFQALLVQCQLQLLCVIGEKRISLFHIIALFDQQLRNGLFSVFLNFCHIFRYHDAGKPVSGRNTAHSRKRLY